MLFVSKPIETETGVKVKRYAVVGKPSDTLINKLTEQGIEFKKFYEPKTSSNKSNENENAEYMSDDSEESAGRGNTQSQYFVNTQDAFGLSIISHELDTIDINITKPADPCALLIEEIDLHGLVNNLMVL